MDTLHALMKGPLPSLFFWHWQPGGRKSHPIYDGRSLLDMDFPGQYITCEVENDQLQTALKG